MAQVKTYLLAPTFAFRPTGPIVLGTIIADPFAPHRALTTADPGAPSPPIDTVVELDRTIHRSTSRAARLGLWAQFLASVGGGVGAERGCDASAEYAMAALRTVCYKEEPGEEEIRARVAAPRVRRAMRAGGLRARPVYMVTGVKIAEGLVVATERVVRRGGGVGAAAPVVEGVSVGVDGALEREEAERDEFRVGDDVVFAYQLLEIGLKGWREKTVRVNEFRPKACFLGDEEEEESDVEIETSAATAESLLEPGRKDVVLEASEVQDGEERCFCIAVRST
ncbi:Carbohydrate-binding-like protein [Neofusicoccum parvum]|nr:Carbohydrate-binding-like protein [Neofusicoccum parvum]